MARAAESRIEVKVGALIVLCLALFIGFLLLLGDFRLGEASTIMVDWKTSAGLKRGAAVKVAGLPAGRVERVEFRSGEDGEGDGKPFVRVHLSIDPEVRKTLRADAAFYITTVGLLGEKYVEIDPGGASERLTSDVLVGVPPMRIEVMTKNLNTLLERSANILRQNEKLIGDTLQDIRAMSASGRKAVEEARLFMGDARKTLADAQKKMDLLAAKGEKVLDSADLALVEYTPGRGDTGNYIRSLVKSGAHLIETVDETVGDGEEIKAVMTDVRVLARSARTVVEKVGARTARLMSKAEGLIDTAQKALVSGRDEILATLRKARALVGDVQVLLARLRDGHGTIGALLNDREMYDDAREMMKDLKRHPWKFLWKE